MHGFAQPFGRNPLRPSATMNFLKRCIALQYSVGFNSLNLSAPASASPLAMAKPMPPSEPPNTARLTERSCFLEQTPVVGLCPQSGVSAAAGQLENPVDEKGLQKKSQWRQRALALIELDQILEDQLSPSGSACLDEQTALYELAEHRRARSRVVQPGLPLARPHSTWSLDRKVTRRPPLTFGSCASVRAGKWLKAFTSLEPTSAWAFTTEDGRPPSSSGDTPWALVASITILPCQLRRHLSELILQPARGTRAKNDDLAP